MERLPGGGSFSTFGLEKVENFAPLPCPARNVKKNPCHSQPEKQGLMLQSVIYWRMNPASRAGWPASSER